MFADGLVDWPRKAKRFTLLVSVSLVVTVLLGWTCAVTRIPHRMPRTPPHPMPEFLVEPVGASPIALRESGIGYERISWFGIDADTMRGTEVVETAAGFPFLSLVAYEAMAADDVEWPMLAQGLSVPALDRSQTTWVLPVRPIWGGLTGNVLITMLLGWTACKLIGLARGGARRRSGRCVWCAYEITGLETCPECGRDP